MSPRFRPAISSMSLGRAWSHNFVDKLAAARAEGIEGLEIFFEDLEYHARSLYSDTPADQSIPSSNLIAAASHIRRLCAQFSLHIICLQPFLQFGGLLDRKHHAKRIEEMRLWIQIAHALGTDIIAVPSSFLPTTECSKSLPLIVPDMREISTLGATANPPIRFVYESLCWGTQSSTWEESWEIVRLVDRPNFGLCLDTFNIAGRIYADPTSPTGRTPTADSDLEASIQRLRTIVPRSKVFLVQLVDAERLSQPLIQGHPWYQASQPARMLWSRNARLFPFESGRGAYLPIMKILDAITSEENGIGYEGWISFELFNRSMAEKGSQVPREHAERCMRSWAKVCQALKWEEASKAGREEKGQVQLVQESVLDGVDPSLYMQKDSTSLLGPKKDSGVFLSVVESQG